MGVTMNERKQQLIAAAAQNLAARSDLDDAGRAAIFLKKFYDRVPPADFRDWNEAAMIAGALSIWRLAQDRPPSLPRLRVFNPEPGSGWNTDRTIVEIVNDDMPFLVDSCTAQLNRAGLAVHLIIHPIIQVERDPDGHLAAIHDTATAPAGARPESVMQIHVDPCRQADALEQLTIDLEGVLVDVRAAVQDWRPVRDRVAEAVARLETAEGEEAAEAVTFLKWVADDHFTFLGYREYRLDGMKGDKPSLSVAPYGGLGLLRDPNVAVFQGLRKLFKMPPEVRDFVGAPDLLFVTKASRRSTVHRPVHMDAIVVKEFGDDGAIKGMRLFLGLFTSLAYTTPAGDIPFLRRKVRRTLERAGFKPGSHSAKALTHVLNTFPRDELFQIREEELLDTALGVVNLQERKRIALFLRRDPFDRFYSCLAYIPRDIYDTDIRLTFENILEEELCGTCVAFNTTLEDSPLGRVHYIIRIDRENLPAVDVEAIEKRLRLAGRGWDERIGEALHGHYGAETAIEMQRRYASAFPVGYRHRVDAAEAVADIGHVEAVLGGAPLSVRLDRLEGEGEDRLHVKLYHAMNQLHLSSVVPILEHMGLEVIAEVPDAVRPAPSGQPIYIHDIEARVADGKPLALADVRDRFIAVFTMVWGGHSESDGFARLVLRAGLDWRGIRLVRAIARFLRQARFAFTQEVMERVITAHADVAALLVELFHARLDPDHAGRAADAIDQEIEARLEAVENLDEDRILRAFAGTIRAILRTNHFQLDADGAAKTYLALKFDSRALPDLPEPRPKYEIFVHSPRMEGIHLRGGDIARGGIRWSDRLEDFRTEILDLMKAQMVKNAVIVPVGAKGGFVLRQPPADRSRLRDEGIACYKLLVSGLLDVTDSIEHDGAIRHPACVVRRDGDDPYLVVAADKGTATFSDIANGMSQAYDFWLDDAFASGGSAGYDHKKMGITARGAWECVKRHFRELGRDIQEEPFSCIGVGDMGGDVFGNGMLLSRQTRLVGAFNHLHIFCDPDPDAEKSFAERQRLFDGVTGWGEYDQGLLSKGGAIFERKAKSLQLTPEIKAAFGLTADRVTPAELIRAMLTAEVDLLFFGGIGTYIKAARETHAEVMDKANDALRVDARQLRAKVIGEGANLGVTQLGRIEFGLAGGKMNTDFIDNSGGVDSSDREVNLKILLNPIMARGELKRDDRNSLLESMTDEVARLVLVSNYQQSQAISVSASYGVRLLDKQARLIGWLEKGGRVNRAIEKLPDGETFAERARTGQGLTRSEIAVLLSHAKIAVYEAVLASDVPDDPEFEGDLLAYFPTAVRERYPDEIRGHKLKREIIATTIANSLVNRAGPTFITNMMEKTGRAAAEIARAYAVTRACFGLHRVWHGIEALDNKVPAALQLKMMERSARLVERAVTWFLAHGEADSKVGDEIKTYRPGIEEFVAELGAVLSVEERARYDRRMDMLMEEGVPEALAADVAGLPTLSAACDIVRIAGEAGASVPETASTYFALGQRFAIGWLRSQAASFEADDEWDQMAMDSLLDGLFGVHARLTRLVIASGGAQGMDAVEKFAQSRAARVASYDQLVGELRGGEATLDLPRLSVAARRMGGLLDD